jgi:hypothetical protein
VGGKGRIPNQSGREIAGEALAVESLTNYVSDYRDVQGIMMPTKRRIYAYDAAMQKVPEPLLVSLDFGNLTFS